MASILKGIFLMANSKINTKQVVNTLLLVLTALIWGSAFVAQSVGAEKVGPFTFLAARSWLGGIFLMPVIAIIDKIRKNRGEISLKPQTKADKKTLLIGGILCGIFLFSASITQQIGIGMTTTAKAGFLTTMYVIIVPIISLIMGKKVGKKIWICVLLGVVGLYLLCMKGGLYLSFGDTMVLVCALIFSGHILVIDRFSPKTDGVRLSCLQFFVVAILSTVCMFIFEKPNMSDIMSAAVPIIYAGILSSGVGYTLQIVGQKGLNPTVASLAMSLESVFSALSGWIILNQSLSLRELSGCILMFGAIILAQLPDKLFTKKQGANNNE